MQQPSNGVSSDIHQQQQQQQRKRQQQFLADDGCCLSVFPISSTQNLNHHFQAHTQPHFQQQQQSHQLFQHQQFRPFQQGEERSQRQVQQQGHASSFFTLNFKLGLNENSGNKDRGANLNHEEAITFLHGNEHNNPPHAFVMPHCWHPQEDSTTFKEPFWNPLDRGNNKQHSENEAQKIQGNKTRCYKPLYIQPVDESSERCKNLDNKYPLFGELEAIYSLAKIAETNQTGSGSVLTGENSPTNAGLLMPFNAIHGQNVGAIGAANTAIGVDHGSENSIGEETSLRKSQRRKRKRKMNENLSFMVGFFEKFVKQVMDHQEMLHRMFLEAIERMDKERTKREETWRCQEAAKYNREAISRAHEHALASSREAQIVSYIEKITGQSINLPARKIPLLLQPEIPKEPIKELAPMKTDNNSRWPKTEVEALIQVRSSIEAKFQEPGLKGPLWEEVSSLMSSMGYQRSAKRCKEKWENINKYFRKTKESTKNRSLQSKTCSYFYQLDQLYSKTLSNCSPSTISMPSSSSEVGVERQGYSELLEAFIVGRDLTAITNPSSKNMKIAEMGCSRLEFDGIIDDEVELEQGSHGKKKKGHEDVKEKGGQEQKDDGGGD